MSDERLSDAREEYLRNQRAVAAAGAVDHDRTPMRIVTLVGAVLAAALFIATVVGYYNDPQEDGPTNVVLPTATSIASLSTLFLLVLPYLLESRTIAARIRNVLVATVLAVVLTILCVGVFVELGSLVADLAYSFTH